MKLRKNNKSVININVPPKIDQNQNQNQNPPQRLTHLTCETLHSTLQHSILSISIFLFSFFLFSTYFPFLFLSLHRYSISLPHSLFLPQMPNLNHTYWSTLWKTSPTFQLLGEEQTETLIREAMWERESCSFFFFSGGFGNGGCHFGRPIDLF